jgi:hypothetical protein
MWIPPSLETFIQVLQCGEGDSNPHIFRYQILRT